MKRQREITAACRVISSTKRVDSSQPTKALFPIPVPFSVSPPPCPPKKRLLTFSTRNIICLESHKNRGKRDDRRRAWCNVNDKRERNGNVCILAVNFSESGCKGTSVRLTWETLIIIHWVARSYRGGVITLTAIRGEGGVAGDSVNRRAVFVISVVGVYSWSR